MVLYYTPTPLLSVKLPSIVYTDSDGQNTLANPHIFTSKSIGPPDPTRFVLVGVATGGSNAITGCTIGGNAATLVASSGGSGTNVYTRIFGLSVPSGTTATITVNLNTTQDAYIGVFAAYNLASTTPVASSGNNTNNPIPLSLNVSAGGVACGYAFSSAGNPTTWTWTGLVFQFGGTVGGSGPNHSGATYTATTAQTPLSASASFGGINNRAACAVSFR
jgi:hypothetical protein